MRYFGSMLNRETAMPEIILLPSVYHQEGEVEQVPPSQAPIQEGAPSPEGFCLKPGCGTKVFRLLDESAGRALVPTCIACNTPYPHTPSDLYLPLLVVNPRRK